MTHVEPQSLPGTSRRDVLLGSLGAVVAATVPTAVLADQPRATTASLSNRNEGTKTMGTITTKDAPRFTTRTGAAVSQSSFIMAGR